MLRSWLAPRRPRLSWLRQPSCSPRPAAASATTLSLRPARGPISSGATVSLTVALSGAPAGSRLRVLAEPYPFASAHTIASPTVRVGRARTSRSR